MTFQKMLRQTRSSHDGIAQWVNYVENVTFPSPQVESDDRYGNEKNHPLK